MYEDYLDLKFPLVNTNLLVLALLSSVVVALGSAADASAAQNASSFLFYEEAQLS